MTRLIAVFLLAAAPAQAAVAPLTTAGQAPSAAVRGPALDAPAALAPAPQALSPVSGESLPALSGLSEVAQLRGELVDAARSYQAMQSRFSPLRGREAEQIDASESAGGHVVSLGSGPDIFRPIVDFPLARHFHLVDILQGWGSGPGEVVFEFAQRIRSIAPGARVEVVQRGFTEFIPEGLIAREEKLGVKHPLPESFWEGWYGDPRFREPLILEARWTSQGTEMVRRFYLHPLDYNSAEHMGRDLPAWLPEGRGVAGLLLTGAPMPAPEMLEGLLARLKSGGSFVFETFKMPDFQQALERLRGSHSVTETPPEPPPGPGLNRSTTYLVRGK